MDPELKALKLQKVQSTCYSILTKGYDRYYRFLLTHGIIKTLQASKDRINACLEVTKNSIVFTNPKELEIEMALTDLHIYSGLMVIMLRDETGNYVLDDYKELLDSGLELFRKKNHDYGSSYETHGLIGLLIRTTDKINRCISIASKDVTMVESESMIDTLVDMNNYTALCLMVNTN